MLCCLVILKWYFVVWEIDITYFDYIYPTYPMCSYIHFLYLCHPTHLTLSFILFLSFSIEFGLYCPTTFDLLEFISLKQMGSFKNVSNRTASYRVIGFCAPTSMMGFLPVLGLYQSSDYYHTTIILLISYVQLLYCGQKIWPLWSCLSPSALTGFVSSLLRRFYSWRHYIPKS